LLQEKPFALLTFLPGALWLLAAGLENATVPANGKILRLLLMNLAALQTLHAYPVAGSQVTWATFLILVACYVLMNDGWALFAERYEFPRVARSAVTVGATTIACISMLFWFYRNPGISGLLDQFRFNRPANLPGAARLHMPAGLSSRYEFLASNIRSRCDSLVTMPGVGSLNVWSGVDPPTGWNATAWMTLIDSAKQQQEVEKLRASARPCAAVCEGCVGFWLTGQNISGEPLVQYIRTELASFAVLDGYDLRGRSGSPRGNSNDLQ